jgi:two-component system chemotaxis response regulator CheY
MRIMVVDDELDTQELFLQRFRKEIKAGRVSFDFATSGEEALGHLRARGAEILLILSDINMPGMSGLELLQKIREAFGPVKVYMITAYDDSEKQQYAREYGADGYMCKPINFDELKQEIFGQDATI